jgi:D-glycero-alpha-D-manno-heptose-7-phosphate kinase
MTAAFSMARPLRVISSVAPLRISDNGGWTDTWFARYGNVFNIGVCPCAEVQVEVFASVGEAERVMVRAENYGEQFPVVLNGSAQGKHPLLEAAIQYMGVPDNITIQVTIFSEVPGGASTGTSAAVLVALIGALDRLRSGQMTPHEVAYAAHHVEMNMLGLQCGIQDQLCSAYGGINLIEVQEFPRATVSRVLVPDSTWWELERRLVLIYLGRSHSSSEVHTKVIRELEGLGSECKKIDDLRHTAVRSRDAISAGDFGGFGRAMIENTEAQGRLHPDLVSADAHRVIEIAKAHGAIGWKVNGAGGIGGSMTILCGSVSHVKRSMIKEIEAENNLFKNVPISLSRHGLRTWEERGPADP